MSKPFDHTERIYNLPDDFLQKWYKPKSEKTEGEIKLRAAMFWIEDLFKIAFIKIDKNYEILKDSCRKCMESKCIKYYNWIIENSEIIERNEEDEFSEIKFKSKDLGKEGIKIITRYNDCKKGCYEKLAVFNDTLANYIYVYRCTFFPLFLKCKQSRHPDEMENFLCIFKLLTEAAYYVPKMDHYLDYTFETLNEEYKKNLSPPEIDLVYNYRIKKRELNEDILIKYL